MTKKIDSKIKSIKSNLIQDLSNQETESTNILEPEEQRQISPSQEEE